MPLRDSSDNIQHPPTCGWIAALSSTASQKPCGFAHVLQEWCTGNGSATAYIPPVSRWENPFLESFNGRFRDEFLNIELFTSLPEAKALAEQHRIEYKVYRPRSSLQRRTPLEVLQQ